SWRAYADGWRTDARRLRTDPQASRWVSAGETGAEAYRGRPCSPGIPPGRAWPRRSGHGVEGFLEAAGVRLLGLGQGLEPVRDLLETLVAGGFRHAGIHVGVLVGLAGDRRLQVEVGRADRLTGRGVADRLEELEMAMSVAGLALRGRAEHGRDVVVALDVSLL